MRRNISSSFKFRQHGVALLILMLLIFLAATTWILGQGSGTYARNQRDQTTATAMAQAKEALIGRAATDDNRPGSLPCPDVNNDGAAESFVGPNCPSYIGRFPWKTLDLPELLDGNGDRLWYALSPGLRDYPIPAQPINSQKVLELTLDGTTNIAAIIFSPGPPLANQNGRPSNAVAEYLDGNNNDGDNAYISGLPSATFNDKALAITRDDIFRTVNQRVLAEIRGPDDNAPGTPTYGLRRYHADFGSFPWADSGNDGIADVGTSTGNLPYNDMELKALPPLPPYTWLFPNGWLPLVTYQRLSASSARITIGTSKMDVIPCPSSPCP
jgi:hypothetical protein